MIINFAFDNIRRDYHRPENTSGGFSGDSPLMPSWIRHAENTSHVLCKQSLLFRYFEVGRKADSALTQNDV